MNSVEVGVQLAMMGATFSKELNMQNVKVGDSLLMKESTYCGKVDLMGARIGGQLDMTSAKFLRCLIMVNLVPVREIFMSGGAEFSDVWLVGSKVHGQLVLSGSRFSGKLYMEAVDVGTHIFIENTLVEKPAYLILGNVGKSIRLSGGDLNTLNLSDTNIKGEFELGQATSPKPTWKQGAKLIMRNTSVGTLNDEMGAWPEEIEITGFRYNSVSALRDISWYKGWIRKQKSYSPQPYEQLAAVLRNAGHRTAADKISYAGRAHEQEESSGWYCLWLCLLNLFIGYGYQTWKAIFWFVGLVFFGVIVLQVSGQGPLNGMPSYGFPYSLDLLLPIIRLQEFHYELELTGLPKYYFFFHQIMGYVLATFLAAGLSGLTKRGS